MSADRSGDRERVRAVFADSARAAAYARKRFPAARERREIAAFGRLVARVESGPRLDAPCGAGRLGVVLAAGGRTTGLDASIAMLDEARRAPGYADLLRGDVFALPFRDRAFAAAACVRLLHHLGPEDRRRVLAEFRRVCRGPIVVSYYDAATFQAWKARKKRAAKGSRKPIARGEFLADLAAVGLRATSFSRPLPFVAEQTFVLVERAP